MGKLPIIQKENFLLEPNRVLLFLFVVHFTPPVSICQLPSEEKVLFLQGFYKFLQTTF